MFFVSDFFFKPESEFVFLNVKKNVLVKLQVVHLVLMT